MIRENERFLVLTRSGGSNDRSVVYCAVFLLWPKDCQNELTCLYEEADFRSQKDILGLGGKEQEKER